MKGGEIALLELISQLAVENGQRELSSQKGQAHRRHPNDLIGIIVL